jgi:hypothetical protein
MYNSYDIEVKHTDGWVAIVNTGTKIAVQLVEVAWKNANRPDMVRCRFGINSMSTGFNMSMNDVLIIAENLYIYVGAVGISGIKVNVTVIA